MPPVGPGLARERAARLRELGDAALRRHLRAQIGRTLPVLVERGGTGRAPDFSHVATGAAAPGTISPLRHLRPRRPQTPRQRGRPCLLKPCRSGARAARTRNPSRCPRQLSAESAMGSRVRLRRPGMTGGGGLPAWRVPMASDRRRIGHALLSVSRQDRACALCPCARRGRRHAGLDRRHASCPDGGREWR